jgi:hypothetical protein
MDPFQGLAAFVLGRLKASAMAAWFRYLFELAFSAGVSFLFTAGSMLFAGTRPAVAVGFGMIWAAMALVYLFRRERSRLTAGMIVALPQDEAQKELESNFQVIEKEKN